MTRPRLETLWKALQTERAYALGSEDFAPTVCEYLRQGEWFTHLSMETRATFLLLILASEGEEVV